jgi:hypothetical protein
MVCYTIGVIACLTPTDSSPAEPTILPPWIVNPYDLVSWWDMEKFAAEKFFRVSNNLGSLAQNYANVSMGMQVPEENRLSLSVQLVELTDLCASIGLKVSALQVMDAANRLVNSNQWTAHSLAQMIIGLGVAISSEMSTHLFLRVYVDRTEFYEQTELFGAAVNANFASSKEDIKEAGCCYTTDRNTACVMHLMRVLEVGLSTLAKTLGVNFDRRNWENVINDIEVEIKKINGPARGPDWKEKQQFYSGAAKDFRYFKDAWRNHAMHFRERYDALEAKLILEHVKAFMMQLADGGLHE